MLLFLCKPQLITVKIRPQKLLPMVAALLEMLHRGLHTLAQVPALLPV
jgi:hypothetical protein